MAGCKESCVKCHRIHDSGGGKCYERNYRIVDSPYFAPVDKMDLTGTSCLLFAGFVGQCHVASLHNVALRLEISS